MKNTGMIRRIDELGRIVIPKEIRDSFGLKCGSALEINVGANGEIILTSHNISKSLTALAMELCEVLSLSVSTGVAVCDESYILAVCNMSSKYIHEKLSDALVKYISNYDLLHPQAFSGCMLDNDATSVAYCIPIISGKICVGAVMAIKDISDSDKAALKLVANYLSKQVE